GWCSLLRTSLCGKFPDLQGKYREVLRFRAKFGVCEVRNRSSRGCFFQKFPKIRNRELILKNRDIFNNIRELNRAIRVSVGIGAKGQVCATELVDPCFCGSLGAFVVLERRPQDNSAPVW